MSLVTSTLKSNIIYQTYCTVREPCFTTFPSTEKKVENTICSEIFLTNLEVFENSQILSLLFDISLLSKLKLTEGENGETKS